MPVITRTLCITLFVCMAFVSVSPVEAANAADDADILRTWVEARAGSGDVVHWIAEGTLHAFPSGEPLLNMIGFDSSRVIWDEENPNVAQHLTRKTFVFTDLETGEIVTEFRGQKIDPIAYPYQLITYRYENGKIYGDVEQGVGDQVTVIKAEDGITPTKMGDAWAFNAAVFLDIPLPNGARMEAWENYDFFIQPAGAVEEPHQMSWARYDKAAPWTGGTPTIMHMLSWRVENHDEFPPQLLEWAQQNAAMWLDAPKDINEIRALQAAN